VSAVRTLRRRRDRIDRDERGVSLVELMATVLLLGIVMSVIFTSIASTQTNIKGMSNRLENLEEARVLMGVLTKDIRTAVRLGAGTSPFVLADKNEAIFYGNLSTTSAPKRVHIFINSSSVLIEETRDHDPGTTAPNYTYTSGAIATKVRLVGQYLANDATRPMFTYLDANGNALGPTPLSAAQRLSIKSVRITLDVKKSSALTSDFTELVNRVRLPNIDYDVVAS
jgi:Tfp pilus assembly protein PilW